jgi:glycosyltransferase involved in cell wall biosynthesis
MPKVRKWLKKQNYHPTFAIKAKGASEQPASASAHFDAMESQQTLVPYDENLLERSRIQWQFGDWASLVAIPRDALQHHPDRAKLALLAAAGHSAEGNAAEARQYTRLAIDWGCSKRLVSQILISGVHNSLGRVAAAAGRQSRALNHFESAIDIGTPGCDTRLLAQARIGEQLGQLGLAVGTVMLKVGSGKTAPKGYEPFDANKGQPDISIVVPVYNLEEILEQCLISIQRQEHQNFEAIIVNDGSTDKTSDVVKRFSEADSRFRLIELESNRGISVARNIGIGECKGAFIRFVDGDDELPPWSNKVLLDNSLNQDLVRGSYTTFGLDQHEVTDHATIKIISDFHPYSLPFSAKSKLLYGICSTIFSSKFIANNKLSFPKNKSMAEDAQFLIDVYFLAARCTFIPEVVYFYKKRTGSLSEKVIIDAGFMLNVANKWMYLLARAKHTSQVDFAKKAFELNINGYIKKNILSKREQLGAADRVEVDSVFDALTKEYGVGVDNVIVE